MAEKTEIHKLLAGFICKKRRTFTEEDGESYVVRMERELCNYLQRHYDFSFATIYDCLDHNYYDEVRIKMGQDREALKENRANNHFFSESLQLFSTFLQSKEMTRKLLKGKTADDNNRHTKITQSEFADDESEDPFGIDNSYPEGGLTRTEIARRKRNRRLRDEVVRRKGCRCYVCDFDFEKNYGERGRRFIEIHHINLLSDSEGEREENPDNLVPLCANCHRMIHRKRDQILTPEQLKRLWNKRHGNK